jgi:hypothetical protein
MIHQTGGAVDEKWLVLVFTLLRQTALKCVPGTMAYHGTVFRPWIATKKIIVLSSVVDPNSFFSDSDSDPQIIFFGFGFGFLD